MKKLALSLLLFLLCIPMLAQPVPSGTHLVIDLQNILFSSTVSNRSMLVQGMALPTSTSSSVIIGDVVSTNTDINGQCTLSNIAAPMLYRVIVLGPPQQTTFTVYMTTNGLGIQNASSNLVANSTATFPAGTVAWSASASDLRYAFAGSAGSAFVKTNDSRFLTFSGPIVSTANSNSFLGGPVWENALDYNQTFQLNDGITAQNRMFAFVNGALGFNNTNGATELQLNTDGSDTLSGVSNIASGTIFGNATPGFVGSLVGAASTATNFTGSLAGDVTGTQLATIINPAVTNGAQIRSMITNIVMGNIPANNAPLYVDILGPAPAGSYVPHESPIGFASVNEGLYPRISTNLVDWMSLTVNGASAFNRQPGLRDPSTLLCADGVFRVVHTLQSGNLSDATNGVGIVQSSDLINWSLVGSGLISCTNGLTNTTTTFWAPEWTIVAGITGIVVAADIPVSGQTNFKIYWLQALDQTFQNWSSPVLICSNQVAGCSGVIDPFIVVSNSTVCLLANNETRHIYDLYSTPTNSWPTFCSLQATNVVQYAAEGGDAFNLGAPGTWTNWLFASAALGPGSPGLWGYSTGAFCNWSAGTNFIISSGNMMHEQYMPVFGQGTIVAVTNQYLQYSLIEQAQSAKALSTAVPQVWAQVDPIGNIFALNPTVAHAWDNKVYNGGLFNNIESIDQINISELNFQAGINITSQGTQGSSIQWNSTPSGGANWIIYSGGTSDPAHAGSLSFYQSGDVMFIDPTHNVGITNNLGVGKILNGLGASNVFNGMIFGLGTNVFTQSNFFAGGIGLPVIGASKILQTDANSNVAGITLDGNTAHFLNGNGAFTTPTGGGGGSGAGSPWTNTTSFDGAAVNTNANLISFDFYSNAVKVATISTTNNDLMLSNNVTVNGTLTNISGNYYTKSGTVSVLANGSNTLQMTGATGSSGTSFIVGSSVGNAINANNNDSILGGTLHLIDVASSDATIAGGLSNGIAATAPYSFIGGGSNNIVSGTGGQVLGGRHNIASGQWSIAMGGNATAANTSTFVFSDNTTFSSTANAQFLIYAGGGIGMFTNGPQSGGVSIASTASNSVPLTITESFQQDTGNAATSNLFQIVRTNGAPLFFIPGNGNMVLNNAAGTAANLIVTNNWVGIGILPNGALQVNAGTDENMFVQPHQSLSTGVAFSSINNANSANEGFEIRGGNPGVQITAATQSPILFAGNGNTAFSSFDGNNQGLELGATNALGGGHGNLAIENSGKAYISNSLGSLSFAVTNAAPSAAVIGANGTSALFWLSNGVPYISFATNSSVTTLRVVCTVN